MFLTFLPPLRWALFWCICNRDTPLLGFELRSSGMQVQYSTNRTILGYLLLSELVGMPYNWLFSSVTPGRKLMHVYSYFGIKITIFFIVMSKLIFKNLVWKYTSLILKYSLVLPKATGIWIQKSVTYMNISYSNYSPGSNLADASHRVPLFKVCAVTMHDVFRSKVISDHAKNLFFRAYIYLNPLSPI